MREISENFSSPTGEQGKYTEAESGQLSDEKWAEAFVGCKIENVGYRFRDTSDVLIRHLKAVRRITE